jgi:AcrR family transcriptional regulator
MEDEDIDQRQRIIDAAKRVFATKGLNGASLREIAREAGVTTGAIYYHFENKNDLLAQVMSKQVHYVEGLSPTNEDGTEKDPAAFLAEVEEGTSRRLLDKEWQRLHMVLAGEAVAQEGEDLAHHRAVYEDVIDKTSRYFSLALGTQDGEKARFAASFLVAALDGMAIQTSFGLHADEVQAMADEFSAFFETGIRAYLGERTDETGR